MKKEDEQNKKQNDILIHKRWAGKQHQWEYLIATEWTRKQKQKTKKQKTKKQNHKKQIIKNKATPTKFFFPALAHARW